MQNSMFGTRAIARTGALAMVALLAQSVPALGQFGSGSPEPMVRVGFGGGVTVPVSDAKDALKNGVNGAGFVLVNLLGGGLPALRFAFTYDRFDYKPTVANGAVGSTSTTNPGSSQIFGGTGGIKIHLVPGPVSPYAMAGVGAFNVRDLVNATSGAQTTISNTDFGVDGGAGIEMRFGRLSAFVEGRIQNVFTQSSGLLKRSSIQSVPVTFGVLF
jgi:opacity protein-like surface antigen